MTTTNSANLLGQRTQLLIILLLPLVVLASSTLLYFTHWLHPEQTSNRGFLLTPVLALTDLGLPQSPISQQRQWQLVQYSPQCEQSCQQRLHQQQQIHMALGKYQPRLRRVLLTNSAEPVATEPYAASLAQAPALISSGLKARIPPEHLQDNPVFVVDPFGNIMLYFTSVHDYRAQLSDLKKLLKNSTIG